jgi:hypothetical protein
MTMLPTLDDIPNQYPFSRWHDSFEHGLDQYTAENCAKVQAVFDQLLLKLSALGTDAAPEDQLAAFEQAVEALNDLNDEIDGLIETGEREDLCELFNAISVAVGLDPADYGDGEGVASEWRDW